MRDQASVDVRWDLTDSVAVSFLTAYTDVTAKTYIDYDNSQWGLVEDTSNGRINLKSEEIQFSGGGDRVEWVAGVFYWDTYNRTRTVGYAMEEFTVNPVGVNGSIAAASRRSDPSNKNANVATLYASPF